MILNPKKGVTIMSIWTDNKYKYKKQYTVWTGQKNLYKVTTAQKDFLVHAIRLDYKKTKENLKKAGYTDINIIFLGRDVSIQ